MHKERRTKKVQAPARLEVYSMIAAYMRYSEIDAAVAAGPAHAPGRPGLPVGAPAPWPGPDPLVLVHHDPHPLLEPAPLDAAFLRQDLRVPLPVRVQRRRPAPAVVHAVPRHERRQLAAGVRHREDVRRRARDEVQRCQLQCNARSRVLVSDPIIGVVREFNSIFCGVTADLPGKRSF